MAIHEERAYPYSREMMLNVIYDTLERLNIFLISVNSERGMVGFETQPNSEGILRVESVYPNMTSAVCLQIEDSETKFANALFDKIDSIIAISKMS